MSCDLQGILQSFKHPNKYYFGLKYLSQVFFFFLSNIKQSLFLAHFSPSGALMTWTQHRAWFLPGRAQVLPVGWGSMVGIS